MVSHRYPLQAIKVLRKGGAAPGQIVLLEQQIQKDVDLVKPVPEEAVSARIRLRKHLWKGTQNGRNRQRSSVVNDSKTIALAHERGLR